MPTPLKNIYNLEFPSYVHEITIGEYVFKRVLEYPNVYSKLEHRVHSDGGEFSTRLTTGSHQITATATYIGSGIEKAPALQWFAGCTQLDDILLLLDLFTGRSVFALNPGEEQGVVITRDPRMSFYGGCLHCAIEYETVHVTDENGWAGNSYDIGFGKTMNKVLALISSPEWQQKYDGGYFLFLYKAAMHPQIIEAMFILCWTIWNQIFSIEHRTTLTDKQLRDTKECQKIAYILQQYFFAEPLNNEAIKEIERLCRCRHRVVHIGKRTDDVDAQELVLFVRATEFLIAKVFGLEPSNLFNTWEQLSDFLRVRPQT